VPLTSAVVPSYNHGRFLPETIASVAAQVDVDVELVIVDDCSTDDSAEIAAELAASAPIPVRVFRNDHNSGVCATVNRAVRESRGDLIALLGSDDRWHPTKLRAQLATVQNDPHVVATFADMAMVDAAGDPLGSTFFDWVERSWFPGVRGVADERSGRLLRPLLRQGNFLPAPTALIRRGALDRVGPFDERLHHEDYDMWLRLSRIGRLAVDATPLADYRVLDGSLSARSGIGFLEDDVRSFARLARESPLLKPAIVWAAIRVLHRAYRDGYQRTPELESAVRDEFGRASGAILALARRSVGSSDAPRGPDADPRITP